MKKNEKEVIEKTAEEILEIIKKVIGITLILLGIVSLFLPILPGILLVILGVALLTNKGIKRAILNLMEKFKERKV